MLIVKMILLDECLQLLDKNNIYIVHSFVLLLPSIKALNLLRKAHILTIYNYGSCKY